LPRDVAEVLKSLLSAGLLLGVATGRGKSVRECLRGAFPKKQWSQIVVGYYNGGELLPLQSADMPDGTERVGPELSEVAAAIRGDGLLVQGKITLRSRQITLSGVPGITLEALCEHADAIVNRHTDNKMRVMRSGHSVDIVPDDVSKLAVVEGVRKLAGESASIPILRIGDRGRWPGNDAQLLAGPQGLSVHEVSSDVAGCWNLAPPGYRGRQATLRYLRQLKLSRRGLRWRLPSGEGGS
jgi:hypothetical protein